jgi:hypothetical protein
MKHALEPGFLYDSSFGVQKLLQSTRTGTDVGQSEEVCHRVKEMEKDEV